MTRSKLPQLKQLTLVTAFIFLLVGLAGCLGTTAPVLSPAVSESIAQPVVVTGLGFDSFRGRF